MTDICTSTPAPFPWSARATDRLHSPLHLCLWPHHSPRLRSPPGPSRHPRVPLSTPRTTPDSSSSSCIDYKSPGTTRTIPVNIPFPNLSGQCPLSKRLQSHQFRLTPVTVSSDSTGLLTTHHRPIAGSHALVSRTSPPAAVVIMVALTGSTTANGIPGRAEQNIHSNSVFSPDHCPQGMANTPEISPGHNNHRRDNLVRPPQSHRRGPCPPQFTIPRPSRPNRRSRRRSTCATRCDSRRSTGPRPHHPHPSSLALGPQHHPHRKSCPHHARHDSAQHPPRARLHRHHQHRGMFTHPASGPTRNHRASLAHPRLIHHLSRTHPSHHTRSLRPHSRHPWELGLGL